MKAPDFDLLGVEGKRYSPTTARGANGLLVMFLCNHCPYVKRAIDRIIRESSELAAQKRFPFPYVIDETQDAARAYGAVCTPEFLGFDAALELQYHGRLDGLFEAMVQIANSGTGPKEQIASIGCSIKWKK